MAFTRRPLRLRKRTTLMTKRRVVVTGIGMISPLGVGNEPTWQGLIEGRSGIGPITKFDASAYACRIAGEVKGFNAEDWIEKKEVKKSDTFIHYAIAAADIAVKDAHLDCANCDGERFGVIVGSGIGGLPLIEEMHTKLLERGPSRVSPFFIPGLIVNLAAGQISIRYGCKGPNSAPATACATGAHAIGDAAEIIRRGAGLGVPYALTHSCYDPDPEGRACGRCDSCRLRRQGFADAGVPDPTRYA